jgi:hypothetical protein
VAARTEGEWWSTSVRSGCGDAGELGSTYEKKDLSNGICLLKMTTYRWVASATKDV